MGRRDCSTRRAIARSTVSSLIAWKESSGETNSRPTSGFAYVVVHLPVLQQVFDRPNLSW